MFQWQTRGEIHFAQRGDAAAFAPRSRGYSSFGSISIFIHVARMAEPQTNDGNKKPTAVGWRWVCLEADLFR